MNIKIIYLFIYLFTISCKSQKIDNKQVENYDWIVFTFQDKNISWNKNDYYILNNKYIIYGNKSIVPEPKYFSFYKKKDTMNIKCYCNNKNNIYIDSISFKKGNFELNIIKFLRKNKLKKGNEVFNISEFKDLNFYKVNLDNPDVIWRKIEERL